MTRAWLILADILVLILLVGSLILFYLYPLKKPEQLTLPSTEGNATSHIVYIPSIDLNASISITLEDLVRMGKEAHLEEIKMEDILITRTLENIFTARTLEERLAELSANIGDAVFVRIFKKEAILEVWIRTKEKYEHLKDYTICAHSGNLGPKLAEGDMQSPEGFYQVKQHHLNPNSKFHLAFNLGYPNQYDKEHERTGSFLMVHGNCISIGCYAMTDEKIEEIYALVEGALKNHQKTVWVHAYPFRMTEKNMALHSNSKWYDFWANLKEGYDYFEAEHLPPKVGVKNKMYTILESSE
jgi:murein L,D-transpeptidase YafK